MERRFRCTACGACCHGWLPLTLGDALRHGGRFPLGVAWTPVRQGHRSFDLTARLGTVIPSRDRRKLAVRIAPIAYLPPSIPCPELRSDGLCGIHEDKPARCRAMPFYAYREEGDQSEFLVPRKGWACDTADTAPVVYRDKIIVARAGFDLERKELLAEAPVLRAYADHLLATVTALPDALMRASAKPVGGDVVVSFASLLRRLDHADKAAFAREQSMVLAAFQARVAADAALADYHRNYGEWLRDMQRLARQASGA
ncbi:MAG: YkgJ family cysteine cluster protein [Solirubrobacterales bacterium]